MPYTAPTVNYSATPMGTYTSLTGVQSVSIRRGRQRFQDPYTQSSCVIELIPANSYALPLAIGQSIDVRATNSASTPCYFQGRITDVTRTYEIPYDPVTGAANQDRITITATGGTGAIGSATLTNYSLPSGNLEVNLQNVISFCGVLALSDFTALTNSAQTLNSAALDAVNNLCRTGLLFLDDGDNNRGSNSPFVFFYNNTSDSSLGFSYSDTGATRFKALEFESSAQNTFNYVEVQPAGLAPQVTSSGSAPFNALDYPTFNSTTADALSLSGYLYNLLSGQLTPVPFTLSTDTATADGCLTVAEIPNAATRKQYLGQIVNITFRGSTVQGQIQGVNTVFYPDRASVQLYFSPSLGAPFRLDSSTNGVLDQNRLGYP